MKELLNKKIKEIKEYQTDINELIKIGQISSEVKYVLDDILTILERE